MKRNRMGRNAPVVDITPLPEIDPPPLDDRASTPLSSEVIRITPYQAARWLEKNHPSNRPMSWRNVEAFANDMRAGAWKLTHQGICFDGDGFLIDGQHRLQAIVNANVAVELLVIKNTAGTFHDPIDRLRPRSVATIMGLAHRDVSAFNTLRMLEAGAKLFVPMTLADADALILRHQDVWEDVRKIPNRGLLPGPVVAAVMWALPCGKDRASEFLQRCATGEMIGRGNPVFAFRSWRERNKRLDAWDVAMAALNCLRHYMNDVPMSSVYIGASGYRAFCSRRRALKVPHTPDVDIVPTGTWTPSKAESGEE